MWEPHGGTSSYARQGTGGRQPVRYVGEPPTRHSDCKVRPHVAILDTGVGQHPWLDRAVTEDAPLLVPLDPATDPEEFGDLAGPLDGALDTNSGHGTFIAGLIHQACPDADIYSWRIVDSEGPIPETRVMTALIGVVGLVQKYYDKEPGGLRIDVLSLSLGFFHESDEDTLTEYLLGSLLGSLGVMGTTVVCAAGNESTARPQYPAALGPWRPAEGGLEKVDSFRLPIVSVGALNPNDTEALFSNTGPWVRSWASGASVVSTMPSLQGGYLPRARIKYDGHIRESIDPDDYTGQFAVWSGTSFSAPLVAGRVAKHLLDSMPESEEEHRATVLNRAWNAVSMVSDIMAP